MGITPDTPLVVRTPHKAHVDAVRAGLRSRGDASCWVVESAPQVQRSKPLHEDPGFNKRWFQQALRGFNWEVAAALHRGAGVPPENVLNADQRSVEVMAYVLEKLKWCKRHTVRRCRLNTSG